MLIGVSITPQYVGQMEEREAELAARARRDFTTGAERRREQYPGSAMRRGERCLERELDVLR